MKNLLFGLSMSLSLGLSAQDLKLHLRDGQTLTFGLQTVELLTHNNGMLEIHVQGQSPASYSLTDVEYFNYNASGLTNVFKVAKREAICLYPNPGKDMFTLDLLSTFSAKLELYDLQGNLLHAENLASGGSQHNLSFALVPGLYILKVSQGKETFVEKLRITD